MTHKLKYGVPTSGSHVVERAEGPDGNCWYEEPRGDISCSNCDNLSNPEHDGKTEDEYDRPLYWCDLCAEAEGLDD